MQLNITYERTTIFINDKFYNQRCNTSNPEVIEVNYFNRSIKMKYVLISDKISKLMVADADLIRKIY